MELKLRGWSIPTQKMSPAVSLVQWLYAGLDESIKSAEQVIFMPFTGLFDRNGKEIYEGDILQHAIETPLGIKVVRGAMYYNKQLAQFGVDMEVTDEDIKVLGATFSVKESVSGRPEVIGNIYENADLLHGLQHYC